VSRSALYDWRDGRSEPTIANAANLASALGWTLDYLAGRSDDPLAHFTAPSEAVADALAHLDAAASALRGSLASTEAAPGGSHDGRQEDAEALADALELAARRAAERTERRGEGRGGADAQAG